MGSEQEPEVIRCVCETEGFCVLCRGLAATRAEAGAREILIDTPDGVFAVYR